MFRVRVGNYRIVYEYDDKNLYVILVEKRGEVYNLLK